MSFFCHDLQIRSLEALHKLFEQFPGAFMDTLHVPIHNRLNFNSLLVLLPSIIIDIMIQFYVDKYVSVFLLLCFVLHLNAICLFQDSSFFLQPGESSIKDKKRKASSMKSLW